MLAIPVTDYSAAVRKSKNRKSKPKADRGVRFLRMGQRDSSPLARNLRERYKHQQRAPKWSLERKRIIEHGRTPRILC